MISEAVSQGVERLMFGDIRPRATQGSRPGYTNYSRAQPQSTPQRTMTRQARTTHDFSDIILESRGDAEDVLDLSLIHISEPTRLGMISYAVFCLKNKNEHN